MAYRGRLLVKLDSKLGEEIDKPLEKMKGPELIRIQVTQPPAPEFHLDLGITSFYTCTQVSNKLMEMPRSKGALRTHARRLLALLEAVIF